MLWIRTPSPVQSTASKPEELVYSLLKPSDLPTWASRFEPSSVDLFILPSKGTLVSECPVNSVAFYEYPFSIGMSFPFSPLIRSFLSIFNLNPGQLFPQIWRVFQSIERVTKDWEDPFDLADLLFNYDFKAMPGFKYTLVRKADREVLLTELGVNDRGWKSKFIFADRKCLGVHADYFPCGWSREVPDVTKVDPSPNSERKTKLFLDVSPSNRKFRKYLGATPLKDVVECSSSSSHETDALKTSIQERAQRVMKRRRLDSSVAKKTNRANAKLVLETPPPKPSVSSTPPPAKLSDDALSQVLKVKSFVDQLLVPGAHDFPGGVSPFDACLDVMMLGFKVMQTSVVAREYCESLQEAVAHAKKEVVEARASAEMWRKEHVDLLAGLENKEREISSLKDRVTAREGEVKKLKRLYDEKVEENKDDEAFFVVRTRAKMMLQFQNKGHMKWNPTREIDRYIGAGGCLEDLEFEDVEVEEPLEDAVMGGMEVETHATEGDVSVTKDICGGEENVAAVTQEDDGDGGIQI